MLSFHCCYCCAQGVAELREELGASEQLDDAESLFGLLDFDGDIALCLSAALAW